MHLRPVPGTLLGAALVAALSVSACSVLDDDPVATRVTAPPSSAEPEVPDLALPEDLCAALDPAQVAALVPGMASLVPRSDEQPGGDSDTSCSSTGGEGGLTVKVREIRVAAGTPEAMAENWFEAACTSARSDVEAIGVGSRSCSGVRVAHVPDHQTTTTVAAVTSNVLAEVTHRRAGEEAADRTVLEALAQQALDAVPDLPPATPPTKHPEDGLSVPELPVSHECAWIPAAVLAQLVPGGTPLAVEATASDHSRSTLCAVTNEAGTAPFRANLQVEVVSHGPSDGASGAEAARADLDRACRSAEEPVADGLGDLECVSVPDDAAADRTAVVSVLRDDLVLHVRYGWTAPADDAQGPPDDAAHQVAEQVLAGL